MGDSKTVEIIHGKSSSKEIREHGSILSSPKYTVRDKDSGKTETGTFSSRAAAVEWAEKKAGKS